jgi:transaldolase
MQESTKFLLDSGDPNEYRELSQIAKDNGSELWGSTTNPSLIAKKLTGKKLSVKEAFALQKDLVLEILSIVPGAVSAEVYAAADTPAEEMIEQGREIATWHERVIVKLPTNIEGFKARTKLRKDKIMTNNTLVFSQQQIFAICLHEQLIQKLYGPTNELFPPFISPFVGRLDDIGEDGMSLVEHGMRIKQSFDLTLPSSKLAIWMLEASVRTSEHMQRGLDAGSELITAPIKIYKEWFALKGQPQVDESPKNLTPQSIWTPTHELTSIATVEAFMEAITSGKLDISHQLTEKGIAKFIEDWKAILV